MKPRIVQIVVVQTNDGEGYPLTVLYGLADDGSVWLADAPNIYATPKWEGPVVLAPEAK